MMDSNQISEDEMEEQLVRMLKDPAAPAHEEFTAATQTRARLPTDQLVQALNEHLQIRRRGNEAYKQGDYDAALHHYTRAKSIVDLVEGLSRADQEEVVANAITIHCNLAAVYLARKEYNAAVNAAEDALGLDSRCEKALVRKAKGWVGKGAWEEVEEVVREMERLGMGNGVGEVRREMEVRKGREVRGRERFGQGLRGAWKSP